MLNQGLKELAHLRAWFRGKDVVLYRQGFSEQTIPHDIPCGMFFADGWDHEYLDVAQLRAMGFSPQDIVTMRKSMTHVVYGIASNGNIVTLSVDGKEDFSSGAEADYCSAMTD